jgi:gluconate 2-dehydrogenase gamma chain
MDRRKSLKTIAVGTVSAGVLLDACKLADKKTNIESKKEDGSKAGNLDRQPEEKSRDEKTLADRFFTEQEMATIAILADIIIPADEVSGSATDAKVPDFIEFIVKDMPQHQVPLRGGLRWLDIQSMKRFGKSFRDADHQDQMQIIDDIAYPIVIDQENEQNGVQPAKKLKPGMEPGVAFFSLMRNLTATGFYTTEIGFRDLGYVGNRPNKWNGVPDDVLKQYGLAYSERDQQICAKY